MTIAESAIAQSQNALLSIGKNSKTDTSAAIKDVATSALNANFDTFLQLLTTQLKNQNPLEPMDADKFTQQLVQYSGVEQQLKTNSQLGDVIGQLKANSTMSVLNFINQKVTFGSPTSGLKDGQASWSLSSPSSSVLTGHVSIRNSANEVVSTQDYTLNPGQQTFNWNGRDKNGIALPEGDYTISVDARDASGGTVLVGTDTTGIVSGIDFSGTSPILVVDGKRLHIADITSITSVTTH